ncbi:MAG: pyridoxamine 5'-phosphate oxidase family protein [Gemmatimonadota bacterium]
MEAGSRTSRVLSRQEIEDFLKQGFWGVLATAVNDQPYGVPIIYAYDDDGMFYVANGPGQKLRNLEANPNVTLTVVELEDYGRRWKSVIVYGRVEFLEDLSDKLHAFNALRKQIPRPAARLRDAAKLAAARVLRIVPTEITGRATGY